jgi:glycine/D-amino acid oxidase-like deaminating enzyme
MQDYPRSWYAETLAGAGVHEPPTGDLRTEVCVIGGGLAGLTTALELACRGMPVVLIERHRIGWGASGRNGGFVSSGFAEGIGRIIARVGLETARVLYDLSREGTEYVRAHIGQLAPEAFMGSGWIAARRYPDRDGVARVQALMTERFGERIEAWTPERTRSALKSARYHDALFQPDAFHIQPLLYARALAREIVRCGGRVCEGTAADAIESTGRGHSVLVRSALGRCAIAARHVVLCVSSYGRHVYRPIGRAVLPVATYVAVTEPLGERVGQAIATGAAVSDTRRAGDYYRIVSGDRILWGGRITTRRSEPMQLAAMMRADMLSVYPQLATPGGLPRMTHAWSGLMGYALHKMPLIGTAAAGLWYATAFGGHGLNTTAMAGRLIALAIAEGDDRYRVFEAYPPRWAGGPLGQVGVQLSYWGMQVKDRWEERTAR